MRTRTAVLDIIVHEPDSLQDLLGFLAVRDPQELIDLWNVNTCLGARLLHDLNPLSVRESFGQTGGHIQVPVHDEREENATYNAHVTLRTYGDVTEFFEWLFATGYYRPAFYDAGVLVSTDHGPYGDEVTRQHRVGDILALVEHFRDKVLPTLTQGAPGAQQSHEETTVDA